MNAEKPTSSKDKLTASKLKTWPNYIAIASLIVGLGSLIISLITLNVSYSIKTKYLQQIGKIDKMQSTIINMDSTIIKLEQHNLELTTLISENKEQKVEDGNNTGDFTNSNNNHVTQRNSK